MEIKHRPVIEFSDSELAGFRKFTESLAVKLTGAEISDIPSETLESVNHFLIEEVDRHVQQAFFLGVMHEAKEKSPLSLGEGAKSQKRTML